MGGPLQKCDCGGRRGGWAKGNCTKVRAGLVRALRAHKEVSADAAFWSDVGGLEYRKVLMAG